MKDERKPTETLIDNYLKNHNRKFPYDIQAYNACIELVSSMSKNKKFGDVFVKVNLINGAFKTRIGDTTQLSKNILEIPNLDSRLKEGDPKLVKEVGRYTSRTDTNFNFYSDARGGDPDSTSPTLRKYHQMLWSKPLSNGKIFGLCNDKNGVYLYHKLELGEFFLGSDAITHSYKNHKRFYWLTKQIPNEVDEIFNTGSTIGAYTVFPNNRIDGNHTINQSITWSKWFNR